MMKFDTIVHRCQIWSIIKYTLNKYEYNSNKLDKFL